MSKTPIKQPSGGASTPYYGGEEIPMQAMKHGKSRVPATSFGKEFTLLQGFINKDDKLVLIERAKEIIKVPLQSGLWEIRSNRFWQKAWQQDKNCFIWPKGW